MARASTSPKRRTRQKTDQPQVTTFAFPAMAEEHLDIPTLETWLTLDASLLKLPKELGEFVIVHELVHRLAPNHGKVFKSFMLAYLPDWEERETRLQKRIKTSKA